MMKSLFSSSGQTGNVSIGSGSCGDAKVMCDEYGMIQVQIDLKDLLNNCFPSNGVVSEENGGNMNNPASSPIIASAPQQNSQPAPQSATQSAIIQAGLSKSFSPSLSAASVQQLSSSISNAPPGAPYSISDTEISAADQESAIDAVNKAYLTYYDLYAKIKNKDSSPQGTAVGGSGNSTNDSLQIGGGLDDYIKGDDLPDNTINTKLASDEYKNACNSIVPFLCGKKTKQAGYCRRNEGDCNVEKFHVTTDTDGHTYNDPKYQSKSEYMYRAYLRAGSDSLSSATTDSVLPSDSKLIVPVTDRKFFQELTDAKTQYDTSLSKCMPIDTRIIALNKYVQSITVNEGSEPKDLKQVELKLAGEDLKKLQESQSQSQSQSKSSSSSEAVVSLDVSKVNEATDKFIFDLNTISSELDKQPSSASITLTSDVSVPAPSEDDTMIQYKKFYDDFTKCIFTDKYPHRIINPDINKDTYTDTLTRCFSDINNTNDVLRKFFETIFRVSLNNNAIKLAAGKGIPDNDDINHELLLLIVNNLRPDDIKDMIKHEKSLDNILTSLTTMLGDDKRELMAKIIEKFKQQTGGRYRKKNHNSNSKSKSKKNKKSSKRKTKKMTHYKSKSKKVRFVKTS